jgi:hypothetical protein
MFYILDKKEYEQYTEENYHRAYLVFEEKVKRFRQELQELVSKQSHVDPIFIAKLNKLIDNL